MGIAFEVLSVFNAKDKVSGKFTSMGKNAKIFGRDSSKAFKKASKSASSFGDITKGILAAGAVQKGIGLLSSGLQSAATDFLNFDNAVLSASAKFKGLDLSTKKGIATLEELKKTARTVGKETEFNAAQAAEGLDFLALAGFNAKQAMALLPGVTNLATVAQVDLATATDIASDSLGAFGLMTEDTEQLTKDFNRVQDVLAKTTASSNTNLTDLFETIKAGAPDFIKAGQSMETFAAFAGVMANSGKKGSKSGMVLKNMMNRLAGPSKKAGEMMKFLGVKIQDGNGKFLDATKIIDNFNRGMKDLTEVQRTQTISTIFGSEIQTGVNLLLSEGGEKLRSYRQMLIDSTGAAKKMAEVMRSSLMNRLKSLGSAATDVGFQLFSAFDKQGASAIDTLTQSIREVDLTPLIENLKTAAGVIGTVFDVIVKLEDPLKIIIGAFLTYKIAVAAAAAAQTVFNIAATANPFGLLVVGAVALSAAIVALVQNWKEVKEAASDFFESIKSLPGFIFGSQEERLKEQRQKTLERTTGKIQKIPELSAGAQATRDIIEEQRARSLAERRTRRAANQTQLESRAVIDGSINLNIAGAPEGSTATTNQGRRAPQIKVNMLEFATPK